jgi:hypothetical protein
MRARAMPAKELDIMCKRWEGGDVIDTKLLIRELIRVFRESEALRRIDSVI